MTEATAILKNYRQSPRKVRLVANAVRGKSVETALANLSFIPKRAATPIQKLIASALANAKNLSLVPEKLVVKSIEVNAGPTLFRRRPRSRGMANPIKKRTSQVKVVLAEKVSKSSKLEAKS